MSTADLIILALSSDNLIEVYDVQNEQSGDTIADATITGQLKSMAGDLVGGQLTFAPVVSASGTYQAIIPDDVALIAGRRYWLDVTIVSDGGNRLLRVVAIAQYR